MPSSDAQENKNICSKIFVTHSVLGIVVKLNNYLKGQVGKKNIKKILKASVVVSRELIG
jgi:hypothetical protein